MAGLIVGLLHILQKVFCGTGNVDGKPNQGSNDYYNNQQQQQQGFPPLQNNYPPQQGIGRPPQQQNAWNGQHINGQQQNAWNGQHNNGQQQSHGYQQHNNNHQNAPYKASNQANLQRPNYQGPSGLVGGSILGPHSKLDPNMVNQSNAHYTALRSQARQHGDRAHQCFQQSQAAYQAGDGARAHELSEEGKAEMRKKDQVDDEAEEWIYRENNTDSPPGTIDLHGLYVKEAIDRTEAAIAQAQRAGQSEIRFIVGKGMHSDGHKAKIKPAIVDLMQKYNLSARIDPHNAGVLIVDLNGREEHGRTRSADAVMDDMSGKLGGDCTIM
ncbi:hypothetical protein QFC20_005116 [Naganishia adeliensis]|uniref:Uncharacterized protein n=1 Tax=Naganishia adeliensis TaxID=92952 RepID=A0ACC2VST5_9TREE|nr:hypothetical protein QFC20_005116 [Naganishia adeliensis]